jgi:hypothetical protein
MTPETVSLFLGSALGSVSKLIGRMVSASIDMNKAQVEGMVTKQEAADNSHDRAEKRGGEWTRRFIVVTVLFAVVIAPFLLAHSPEGITVGQETSYLFGIFSGVKYQTLSGYLILPEIRQTILAIVGFYFGSSQIK